MGKVAVAATRVYRETSIMLNLWALQLLEGGPDTTIPEMKASFFYAAMTTMAKLSKGIHIGNASKWFGEVIPLYRMQYNEPGDEGAYAFQHLTQVLTYLGNEFMTNCENHVALNMNSRVKSSLRVWLVRDVPQKFSAPDMKRISSHIIRQLADTPDDAYLPWDYLGEEATDETRALVDAKILALKSKYGLRLPTETDDSHVRKEWWLYLR